MLHNLLFANNNVFIFMIFDMVQASGGESTHTLPFSLISPAANEGITCPVPQNREFISIDFFF